MAGVVGRGRERAADRLAILQALRRRDFRLYWVGLLMAILGWQIQYVATAWRVLEKTSRETAPIYLGLVGLATSAPTIAALTLSGTYNSTYMTIISTASSPHRDSAPVLNQY